MKSLEKGMYARAYQELLWTAGIRFRHSREGGNLDVKG